MDLLRQNENSQRDQKGKPRDAHPQDSARGDKPAPAFILFIPAAKLPKLPFTKRNAFSDQPDRMIESHRISKYKIKEKACYAGCK